MFRQQVLREEQVLDLLPSALGAEVKLRGMHCLLDNLPFFGDLDEGTKAEVARCADPLLQIGTALLARSKWQPTPGCRSATG